MSPIGRIFIVLNLVLAVVFLGWASSNLVNSQNYKAEKEAEVAAHAATKADLDGQIDDLNNEKSGLERDLANTRGGQQSAEAERDRNGRELADLQSRYDSLQSDVQKISGTLESYDSTNKEQANRAEAAEGRARSADEARHSAENSQEAAEAEQARLQRALDVANNQIADLSTDLTSTQKTLGDTQTALDTMIAVTGARPEDFIVMPQIDGAVLMVSHAINPGLISINRGANDGVKRGFTFDIYDGGQFKGRVRVETVEPDMCSAVIIDTYDGRSISQGDSASTRI